MTDVEDMMRSTIARIDKNRIDVALRLRDAADAVDRVNFKDPKGNDRDPATFIGEIWHEVNWAVANLPIQTMLMWATQLNELKALPDDTD